MADINYVTGEGLERMKKELAELKTKGRSSMAKQIQEAREKGDLSENAEYDAARAQQGFIEGRISELEAKLGNAQVISLDPVEGLAREQPVAATYLIRQHFRVREAQVVKMRQALDLPDPRARANGTTL